MFFIGKQKIEIYNSAEINTAKCHTKHKYATAQFILDSLSTGKETR